MLEELLPQQWIFLDVHRETKECFITKSFGKDNQIQNNMAVIKQLKDAGLYSILKNLLLLLL